MTVYDLSRDDDRAVTSTDPLETVRTYVALCRERQVRSPGYGEDVASYARRDVQAEITVTDLEALVAEVERLRAGAAPADGPTGGTSICWHVRTRKGQVYGVGAFDKTDARTLVARRIAEQGEDDTPTTAERIGQWSSPHGTVLHYGDA